MTGPLSTAEILSSTEAPKKEASYETQLLWRLTDYFATGNLDEPDWYTQGMILLDVYPQIGSTKQGLSNEEFLELVGHTDFDPSALLGIDIQPAPSDTKSDHIKAA